VFSLAGPDDLTADAFVDALGGGGVTTRHLTGILARVLAHVHPRLTPAMIGVLAADSLPDAPSAADALGIRTRSVRDVYT